MHTKKELDRRLREAGVRPLKHLGQNFLVNPEICRRILEPIKKAVPQSVVEIGPGLGALTDELLDQNLLLIELDKGFVKYWKDRHPSLNVLHQDALKVDWSQMNLPGPRVLVSNLPYSIAASLVVELSSLEPPPFELLVLMFQKEVAERIMATQGSEDYGMLSVVAQAAWEIRRLVDAGPQDFHPVPNVGSRVLALTPKKTSFNRAKFLEFVKLGFSQRRKKIFNNLSSKYASEILSQAFTAMGLEPSCRAQELSVGQWVEFFMHTNT